MRRLLRNRRVVIGVHTLVILGLIASLGVNWFHQQYMTRGVEYGRDATPIPHTDVNPMGVNTFLHEEADPENIERTLDMVAEAGFTYIRQIFVWAEIEPAQDTYWDPNNDVDSWAKYDRIMEMAEERNLDVVVRLDKPPRWAREGQPDIDQFPAGPPNDYQDYAEFVSTVIRRYQGQIEYVQLWNEPNLGFEWGGYEVDPADFTELLEVGYEAVKGVDPDVKVLMPGLAPNDQTGPDNMSDLLFLEEMYEAGAADYFDIASVMVYGYGYSPWDRRVDFERNNFSRPIQTREIMEEYGDTDKPVWALEYGWVSLPDGWDGEPSPWGEPVSEEEQAEYLYEGYRRAQQEWPWMGAMMVWGFRWAVSPEHPDQAGNPTQGFRIVNHDFSPRPAYDLLKGKRPIFDRAYTGAYEADSRLLLHDDDWSVEHNEGTPVLVPQQSGAELTLPFTGTGLEIEFTGSTGTPSVALDDEPISVTRDDLASGSLSIEELDDDAHWLEISISDPGEDPLTITGFTVTREPITSWIYPWLNAGIGIVLLLNFLSLAVTMIRPRAESAEPVPGDTGVDSAPRQTGFGYAGQETGEN